MSEAASNLAKHAVGGTIVLRIVRTGYRAGIEFLALDQGPGMDDVAARCATGGPAPARWASAWESSPGCQCAAGRPDLDGGAQGGQLVAGGPQP